MEKCGTEHFDWSKFGDDVAVLPNRNKVEEKKLFQKKKPANDAN